MMKNLTLIPSIRSFLRKSLIKTVHLENLTDAKIIHLLSPKSISPDDLKDIPKQFLFDGHTKDTVSVETFSIYAALLEQVIYFPNYNTVFSKNRRLIIESMSYSTNYTNLRLEKFNLRELYFTKYKFIGGISTIFRGHERATNYYHCLIDHLPRLYLLHHPEYGKNSEIDLLVGSPLNAIEEFFVPKLAPKNLRIKVVPPNKFYRLEKMIFPSFLSPLRIPYLPQEYLKFFHEKVCPQRSRNKVNRIFISRPKTRSRHILNEEELWAILQNYGFQKYILEEMSIEQQIEFFYDAEYVIAAHGAGLTNIIFSETIKVLEIFPYLNMNRPHYFHLSKSLGHSYDYSSGHRSSPKSLGFTANLAEIEEKLHEMVV